MEMDPEYREVFGLDEEAGGAAAQEPPDTEQEDEHAAEPEDPPAPPAEAPETADEEEQRWQARKREWQTQEEQAAQARVDRVYAELFHGQTDPATGKAITNEAEYRAFRQRKDQEAQEQTLRDAGLQPELLERLVDQRVAQHPAVAAAQAAAEAARAQQARAVEQQAQAAIAAELRSISAADPSVKTLEDIARMPTAAEFNRYVRMGNTLSDAFYLANRRELEARRSAAAKQAAINQTRGKRSLLSGAGGGGGGADVPAEEAAAYRQIMPEATDAEIARAWAAYQRACQ